MLEDIGLKRIKIMNLSKNGFLLDYDSTKRLKYGDKINNKVCDLRKKGMSYSEISNLSGISKSRLHYIFRRNDLILKGRDRPRDKKYLTRSESILRFGITSNQFDYVKNNAPDFYLKKNDVVYVHSTYFEFYNDQKYGYRKSANRKSLKAFLPNFKKKIPLEIIDKMSDEQLDFIDSISLFILNEIKKIEGK